MVLVVLETATKFLLLFGLINDGTNYYGEVTWVVGGLLACWLFHVGSSLTLVAA